MIKPKWSDLLTLSFIMMPLDAYPDLHRDTFGYLLDFSILTTCILYNNDCQQHLKFTHNSE
jgi:uncharacterized membrane protein YkvA (DUF1232 family)